MTNLQNILANWKRYSTEDDPNNLSVFKWCESLLLVSDIYKEDTSITADIITAAIKYFDEDLSEQDRRDAFFYILGVCTRK